jgi:hypothetical protein
MGVLIMIKENSKYSLATSIFAITAVAAVVCSAQAFGDDNFKQLRGKTGTYELIINGAPRTTGTCTLDVQGAVVILHKKLQDRVYEFDSNFNLQSSTIIAQDNTSITYRSSRDGTRPGGSVCGDGGDPLFPYSFQETLALRQRPGEVLVEFKEKYRCVFSGKTESVQLCRFKAI